jgi:RNA polymerase sigma factor (sigma-70 family)
LEASAIPVGALRSARVSRGSRWLRLRSDEQLVALFRAGDEQAFRVIHERYERQLLAFVRRILFASPSEAEDVLQDVFARASQSLRAHDRVVSLRPWLYRIARNACIDELRRHCPVDSEVEIASLERASESDPVAESEQRELIRRLVIDVGRLPDKQRSALVMRELDGLSYGQVAVALGTSVPAVKSLLVRARMRLAESLEARETACAEIRDDLAEAYARGVRPSTLAARHLRDCACCQRYRLEIGRRSRALAALVPPAGLLAPLIRLLPIGAGTRTASGMAGGAASAGGGGAGAVIASAGGIGAGAAHLAAIALMAGIAAAGAIELHDLGQSSPTNGRSSDAVPGASGPTSLVPARSPGALALHVRWPSGASGGASPARASSQPPPALSTAGIAASRMLPLGAGFSQTHRRGSQQSSAPLGAGASSLATCSSAQQPTGLPDCAGEQSAEPTGASAPNTQVGGGGDSAPLGATGGSGSSGATGTTGAGSGTESSGATGSQVSEPAGAGTSASEPAGTGTSASEPAGAGTSAAAPGDAASGSPQQGGQTTGASGSQASVSSGPTATAGPSASAGSAGLSDSSALLGVPVLLGTGA